MIDYQRLPLSRIAKAAKILGVSFFVLVAGIVSPSAAPRQGAVRSTEAVLQWPSEPPARICGNAALLSGPETPPEGAVIVPAGSNAGFDFNRPGATFWFAPGTHTLGEDVYGQIIARDNAIYVGAPGAVIDGRNLNLYAFTGTATNVTIRYLTIRNFGRGLDNNNEGVVNHDAGDGWLMEYNTVSDNDGAGVFLGSGNVVRYNCLKDNGQYGFSMFKMPVEGDSAIKNIVLDRNEIAGNNTDDWETREPGCGCTGGGKFWDVQGAKVTNNWVHDNKSVGLWADTNNIDFLFEGNYIADNDDEGIWYEISYNATIRGNTLINNAWVKGQRNQGSRRRRSTCPNRAAMRVWRAPFPAPPKSAFTTIISRTISPACRSTRTLTASATPTATPARAIARHSCIPPLSPGRTITITSIRSTPAIPATRRSPASRTVPIAAGIRATSRSPRTNSISIRMSFPAPAPTTAVCRR
ncbi:hypothetical protein FCE95_04330 [Luteimonas gilva]|uniref:Right handed beta helix domain-containing protein n=1 Tax=Luteimonas gilva TaxID=2572684 RepID=A0A4U5JUH5_9GAMM|nr:right-handed parallel beta-helix repeat-containing protein [Luteimonas gilva]TKR33530.1 hypothetical protein FCE95_04330 [Luteimonas gilva]